MKRMMGLEPTTFCMASRRSSRLSYIRTRAQYSPLPGTAYRALTKISPAVRRLEIRSGVERLVDEPVGELVVLSADGAVFDGADATCEARRLQRERP